MMDPCTQLRHTYAFPAHPEWVRPAYEGESIVNLMNSLLAYYGIPHGAPLAFHESFVQALHGKRKILFLLVDGFGWYNLASVWQRNAHVADIIATAQSWPLTTVFPSTTSTASASYLTALPPSQHSVLGFLMYFPEYGRNFNMLSFRSADAKWEELTSFGFSPDTFMHAPSVLDVLSEQQVMVGAYNFHVYAGSGLSRLIYAKHPPHPYIALADLLWLPLDQLPVDTPQFHFLYWSTLDTIAHMYGARSEPYALELEMLLTMLYTQILPRLGQDTALVVCADHGHIDGDDNEAVNLATLPGLMDLFRVPPSGEGRATQLFIKPGEVARARDILDQTGVMLSMSTQEFLDSRLLGNPPLRPDIIDRLGDLVAFPHGSRRTLYPYEPRPHTAMVGRHGGLSPQEMVVPLLVWA